MRVLPIAVGVMLSVGSAPQTRPGFDAASVKPNRSGETRTYYSGFTVHMLTGEPVSFLPRISFTNIDVTSLILRAYGIPAARRAFLVGGPAPILSARFNIAATVPDGATKGRSPKCSGRCSTIASSCASTRKHATCLSTR